MKGPIALINVRNTALVTAIALSVVRAHWMFGQIRALARAWDSRWIYIVQAAVNLLSLVPMPVLLLMLYTSNVKLDVPKTMRYLALATALVQGLFAAPAVYVWTRALPADCFEIRNFPGTTAAAKLWGWLQTSTAPERFWSGLLLCSEVAFLFFLVALFLPEGEMSQGGGRPSHAVKLAALVAAIVGALVVVSSIGRQVYAAVMLARQPRAALWLSRTTLQQVIVLDALSLIPVVCWFLAALIVYKSSALMYLDAAPAAAARRVE